MTLGVAMTEADDFLSNADLLWERDGWELGGMFNPNEWACAHSSCFEYADDFWIVSGPFFYEQRYRTKSDAWKDARAGAKRTKGTAILMGSKRDRKMNFGRKALV
jgi:hypothetical protein